MNETEVRLQWHQPSETNEQEWFYQVQGDMLLRVIENDTFRDIPIKEGEMFLLPGTYSEFQSIKLTLLGNTPTTQSDTRIPSV